VSQPSHITYAQRRARAARTKAVPMKTSAIWCVRDLVEEQRASVDEAVSAITAAFALGLADIEDIRAKARAKYAVAA
jgi:hypothetical protein